MRVVTLDCNFNYESRPEAIRERQVSHRSQGHHHLQQQARVGSNPLWAGGHSLLQLARERRELEVAPRAIGHQVRRQGAAKNFRGTGRSRHHPVEKARAQAGNVLNEF